MTWPLLLMEEVIGTTTLLHVRHWERRVHRQTLCQLVLASVPLGNAYVATCSLFSMFKIMMISIMFMFVALRSHMHVSDVTNMLLVVF
jgi:hypothetical protein